MNSLLTISFINARGLNKRKFEELLKLIEPESSILFVGETWYAIEDITRNCSSVICSTIQQNVNQRGRQHGGLICLANPITKTKFILSSV